MRTDFVVFDNRMEAFHCQSCDAQYRTASQTPAEIHAAIAKVFAEIHSDCYRQHGWKFRGPTGVAVEISERQP